MINDFLLQHFDEQSSIDKMALYHLRAGGKRLRGRLVITAAKELVIDSGKALLWAGACELLHNATLIHDDIQDNDPIRRGQPSLWKRYGVAQAINVGDLFIFKSFRLASQLEDPQLTLLLAQAAETLVKGQSEELNYTGSIDQFWDTYLRVARLKTGVLFQLPLQGLHLLKNKNLVSSYNYAKEWSQLGVVYQIFDDLNDFLGLKQDGQKQKDLLEKRINAIVSYISQNRMYHPLIKNYVDCKPNSLDHKDIVAQINSLALEEDILGQLKNFSEKLLQKFKQNAPSKTKDLILGEISKSLNQETSSSANVQI